MGRAKGNEKSQSIIHEERKSLNNISIITNWKEEQIDIMGETKFKEEYELQFISTEKNKK